MDELEQKVHDFRERRGADYVDLLDIVLADLYKYKDAGPNSSSIYRIYSRADKQKGGVKLKSEAGIVRTLRKWMKKRPGVDIEVSEVHDIVGVTIVTYFESEVAKIVDDLKAGARFPRFSVHEDWEKRDNGYYAHHLAVSRPMGALHKYLCEIQVKSLLNDGWAAKTHDLTYKARSELDPEVKRQVELIGVIVQTLELQSDSLRNLITRGQQLDGERRDAAVFHLLQVMTSSQEAASEPEVVAWSEKLLSRRDHLSVCERADLELEGMVQDWRAILKRLGPSQISCRLITLLAVIRIENDLDIDACETIDRWISRSRADGGEGRARAFKTIAHWALGDYDGAIKALRSNIEDLAMPEVAAQGARLNLAYYMAERHFLSDGPCKPEQREEILALTEGWEATPDERARMSRQDSLGAIKIMTAQDADQVFEGWRLCNDAYAWGQGHEDAPVFSVFYTLHSGHARRRIQELGMS